MFAATVLAMALSMHGDEVTRQNYEKIGFGMNRPQVCQILGRASLGVLGRDPTDLFHVGSIYSLIMEEEGEVWRFGAVTIWVRFDNKGRVNGKSMQYPARSTK